ncbi:MAG: hypothetical protein HY782_02550, partial [Chloroflexi bacterium]|nr:hypothetical protein [Chloroflexota bacterium]
MPSIIPIPDIQEDATANVACHPAKDKDLKWIALPLARVPNWQQKAIEKFAALLREYK